MGPAQSERQSCFSRKDTAEGGLLCHGKLRSNSERDGSPARPNVGHTRKNETSGTRGYPTMPVQDVSRFPRWELGGGWGWGEGGLFDSKQGKENMRKP